MSQRLTSERAAAAAALAGHPVEETTAVRIASAIGPALESFGTIEGALGFELEPSGFLLAQRGGEAAR